MTYLVTNVRINDNKRFKMQLPEDFAESGYLAKLYIRTYAFECCEVTFDFETYKIFEDNNGHKIFRYDTQYTAPQPYNVNITDSKYDKYIEVSCLPLPKSGVVLDISEHDLKCADNDVEQAIYEKLLYELEVDFVYEYTA